MPEFSLTELTLIKAALVIMRDINAANSVQRGDECDLEATHCAEIIVKLEHAGI